MKKPFLLKALFATLLLTILPPPMPLRMISLLKMMRGQLSIIL